MYFVIQLYEVGCNCKPPFYRASLRYGYICVKQKKVFYLVASCNTCISFSCSADCTCTWASANLRLCIQGKHRLCLCMFIALCDNIHEILFQVHWLVFTKLDFSPEYSREECFFLSWNLFSQWTTIPSLILLHGETADSDGIWVQVSRLWSVLAFF